MNYWENIYKKKKQIVNWPFSDLVSLFTRFSNFKKKNISVLELGCGAAPNANFFLSKKINYVGIDFSKSIIKQVSEKFKKNKNIKFYCLDISKPIKFKKKFDYIIDRGSITHLSEKQLSQCIHNIFINLKNQGLFFSIDLFSTNHSIFKRGSCYDSYYTRIFNKKKDRYYNCGKINFFSKKRIINFFGKKFKIIELVEKNFVNHTKKNERSSFWQVVFKKK
jgi:cyclopropane fatty-acyl-phospholipid synthase-like methyltransferase